MVSFSKIAASKPGNVKIVERADLLEDGAVVVDAEREDPVVGQHELALVGLRQSDDPVRADLGAPEPLVREHQAVAGQDHVVFVDDDRAGLAEFLHRAGQLGDLIFRMRTDIAGRRLEIGDLHKLGLHRARLHAAAAVSVALSI